MILTSYTQYARIHTRYRSLLVLLMFVSAGCASKGKAIQTGAAQFEAASLSAIEKIDNLRMREVAAPDRTPDQASDDFVAFVLAASGNISNSDLELFADPFTNPNREAEAEWQRFMQQTRRQYVTLAATFASLDRGGLFARPSVESSIPILDKLIAQMAVFAQRLAEHPAEFIRERAAVAEDLEAIRDEALSNADLGDRGVDEIVRDPDLVRQLFPEADRELRSVETRLRLIRATELQVTRDAIEQALTAVRFGRELRQLLVDFDKLSIDDISEGLAVAFRVSSVIPGLDLSDLQAETEQVLTEIRSDPDLSTLFNTVIGEIPSSVEARSESDSGEETN